MDYLKCLFPFLRPPDGQNYMMPAAVPAAPSVASANPLYGQPAYPQAHYAQPVQPLNTLYNSLRQPDEYTQQLLLLQRQMAMQQQQMLAAGVAPPAQQQPQVAGKQRKEASGEEEKDRDERRKLQMQEINMRLKMEEKERERIDEERNKVRMQEMLRSGQAQQSITQSIERNRQAHGIQVEMYNMRMSDLTKCEARIQDIVGKLKAKHPGMKRPPLTPDLQKELTQKRMLQQTIQHNLKEQRSLDAQWCQLNNGLSSMHTAAAMGDYVNTDMAKKMESLLELTMDMNDVVTQMSSDLKSTNETITGFYITDLPEDDEMEKELMEYWGETPAQTATPLPPAPATRVRTPAPAPLPAFPVAPEEPLYPAAPAHVPVATNDDEGDAAAAVENPF